MSVSMTAPPTQNTAPVLEFRCLYTHDLKRKQKRWQDGYLKFHTFNKRIMVYDVPRNYIGDSHWCENVPVQDGDEFSLDRGVLIQVGEGIGAVQQDLTELLARRKKVPEITTREAFITSPNTSAGSPAGSLLRRDLTDSSHLLQPKALNAVLGSPRGRIGRADLPVKSPYQIRQGRENVDWNQERPAKRLRIDQATTPRATTRIYPSNHNVNTNASSIRPSTAAAQTSNPIHVSTSSSVAQQEPQIISSSPDLSSDPETPPAKVRPKPRSDHVHMHHVAKPIPPRAAEALQSDRRSEPLKVREKAASAGRAKKRPPQPTSTGRPIEHQSESREPVRSLEASSDKSQKKTRLQMAVRQPRRKLMYKDLLPVPVPQVESMPRNEILLKDRSRQAQKPMSEQLPDTATVLADTELERPRHREILHSPNSQKMTTLDDPVNESEKLFISSDESSEDEGIDEDVGGVFEKDLAIADPNPREVDYEDDEILPPANNMELALTSKERSRSLESPMKPPGIDVIQDTMVMDTDDLQVSSSSPLLSASTKAAQQSSIKPGEALEPTSTSASIESEKQGNNHEQIRSPDITSPGSERNNPPRPPTPFIEDQHIEPLPESDLVTRLDIQEPPIPTPFPSTTMLHNRTPRIPISIQPLQVDHNLIIPTKPLPTFRQPTRLKKSTSDMTTMESSHAAVPVPKPVEIEAELRPARINPNQNKGTCQDTNAWSNEAWDLFGCGRDGISIGFGGFVKASEL